MDLFYNPKVFTDRFQGQREESKIAGEVKSRLILRLAFDTYEESVMDSEQQHTKIHRKAES